MAIYRTALTANFTTIANESINSSVPPVPFKVHTYLLSKPANWQPKISDIKKQLGLSTYAVKKALRWLLKAGLAVYKRLKTGHTFWDIFDTPRTQPQTETAYRPVIPPQFDLPTLASQPVLTKTETEKKKETTTPILIPAPPIPESVVVVGFEEVIPNTPKPDSEEAELIYPVQLTPIQKKDAKHKIKKVKKPELKQDILFELAYIITSGKIKKSVPACLQGLVDFANENGYFIRTEADSAKKQGSKPLIAIWPGFGQSTPSKPEVAKGYLQQAKTALKGAS